jgi:hypothetical protein
MNASTHRELPRKTDHLEEHHSNPRVDTVPQTVCSEEQAQPRTPAGSFSPDEGPLETFIDGAGI